MNTLEIREILALPLHHRATTTSLVELYTYIKQLWTSEAITELKLEHNINLKTTKGKCTLARLAGEIELQHCDSPQVEKKRLKELTKKKVVGLSYY